VDGCAKVRCSPPQGDEVRTWLRDEEAKLDKAVKPTAELAISKSRTTGATGLLSRAKSADR
jgi:hypothetical protein